MPFFLAQPKGQLQLAKSAQSKHSAGLQRTLAAHPPHARYLATVVVSTTGSLAYNVLLAFALGSPSGASGGRAGVVRATRCSGCSILAHKRFGRLLFFLFPATSFSPFGRGHCFCYRPLKKIMEGDTRCSGWNVAFKFPRVLELDHDAHVCAVLMVVYTGARALVFLVVPVYELLHQLVCPAPVRFAVKAP
jgi:hypothetical protein